MAKTELLRNLMGYAGTDVLIRFAGTLFTLHGGERNGGGCSLSASVVKAVCLYHHIHGKNDLSVLSADSFVNEPALIQRKDNTTLAENRLAEEVFDVALYNPASGIFTASTITRKKNADPVFKEYRISKSQRNGTILILAMLPHLIETNADIKNAMEDIEKESDWEAIYNQFFFLSDRIYHMIKDNDIKCDIQTTGTGDQTIGVIRPFTALSISSGTYSYTDDDTVFGAPQIFTGSLKQAAAVAVEMEKVAGKYRLSERKLTKSEEYMVPKFEKGYRCNPETKIAAELIQKSTNMKHRIRNGMYYGEPGCGKTTIVKEIAAALGLPYTVVTCDPSTEIFNLVGQLLPATGDSKAPTAEEMKKVFGMLDLPTPIDVRCDLKNSYCRMTGEEELPIGFDENECMDLLFYKLIENISRIMKQDGKDFVYVPSELVKALKYGYVCEIQEPSNIRQAGVLTGLNNIMDINSGTVTLPTGEIIQRHPDAVVFYTTNIDLEGCKAINQSVISRCQIVKGIPLPNKETMINWVLFDTDVTNRMFASQCVEVGLLIKEYLQKNMLTDGCCGIREILDWAEASVIMEDPITAAECTIIPKATMEEDAQVYIRQQILEVQSFEKPV